ncbi:MULTISPECIES: amidohydrolase family protein [Streptomyces]|uniref:amidohydrolase family protein n=1 Tax=Streptomyces TaxID=1883 RepID=UPI0031E5A68D
MRVIDLETVLPGGDGEHPGTGQRGPAGPDRLPNPQGYGWSNYDTIFTRSDTPDAPAVNAVSDTRPPAERAAELVKLMDQAGVVKSVVAAASNAVTAEVVQAFPNRFIGFAHLSPYDGMRAVRELERLVREEGIGGLSVAALYDVVSPSDRRYYPLYAKAVELGIPVRIYTSMPYANDRPYDLAHPRHLDTIAMDFPELTIIAGLSGWPWINDMVGLLRRHPNLFCDTAAHRPKYLGQPGSGWEQFMQFGNTLIQDKVMVGLSWGLLGMSMEDIIDEYLALPLKESVKEKWLYSNACRVLGTE